MSHYDAINDHFTRKTIKKYHKCNGCGAMELDKNGKCAYCGNNWFGEKLAHECDNCKGRGFNWSIMTVKAICTYCKGTGIIL